MENISQLAVAAGLAFGALKFVSMAFDPSPLPRAYIGAAIACLLVVYVVSLTPGLPLPWQGFVLGSGAFLSVALLGWYRFHALALECESRPSRRRQSTAAKAK